MVDRVSVFTEIKCFNILTSGIDEQLQEMPHIIIHNNHCQRFFCSVIAKLCDAPLPEIASVVDVLRAKEDKFMGAEGNKPLTKKKREALLFSVRNSQQQSIEKYTAALELRAVALLLLAPSWGNSRKGHVLGRNQIAADALRRHSGMLDPDIKMLKQANTKELQKFLLQRLPMDFAAFELPENMVRDAGELLRRVNDMKFGEGVRREAGLLALRALLAALEKIVALGKAGDEVKTIAREIAIINERSREERALLEQLEKHVRSLRSQFGSKNPSLQHHMTTPSEPEAEDSIASKALKALIKEKPSELSSTLARIMDRSCIRRERVLAALSLKSPEKADAAWASIISEASGYQ